MNTKKELDEDWIDTLQTLESLRSVIVKQRKKWRRMMADNLEVDDIKKLHKDSEVLEHMINRIENGMTKSRCTITLGERMLNRITSGEKSDTEE
tara:strand:+ start:325 stop:606 length:282 start_codon:yes stop_codon:yes gene_type:complete